MLEKTSYYPGQKTNEEIVLFIRRHWVAYFKWAAILTIMILVPTIFFIIYSLNGILFINQANKIYYVIVISLYSMLTLAIFLTTWIDYYLDVTIVTKEHLINIRQDEIFNRSVAEQSLLRVQDVSSKMTGFWQTNFKFGTVYVETAGEQPNFRMTNIPNPHVVASTIMKIHEELIAEHELGEEITEGIGMDRIKPLVKKEDVSDKENKIVDVKNELDATKKEEVVEIEPSGEEKIILIQDPQKSENKNTKQTSDVKKVPNNSSKKEIVDFKTTRDIIDQPIAKKDDIKDIKANKKSINDVEGELQDGEEIKF